MPQLVKKRRSGWAVLAVGALVASILAVGAGSIAAQPAATDTAASPDNNPEWGASWSACVGAAGSYDAMFSDVGDGVIDELADAINCIGYYGITVGMGERHLCARSERVSVRDEAVRGAGRRSYGR